MRVQAFATYSKCGAVQHLIVFVTIATFKVLSKSKAKPDKEMHIPVSELRMPPE